jgi:hypothetical protein
MMMIAAAAGVGEITGDIQSDRAAVRQPNAAGRTGDRARRRAIDGRRTPAAGHNAVHERWMNAGILCVREKFWGEPCAYENTP